MPIPDLNPDDTTPELATGILQRLSVKREGSDGSRMLLWDLDLAHQVGDGDLEALEALLPGASITVEAGKQAAKVETRKDATPRQDVRLLVYDPEAEATEPDPDSDDGPTRPTLLTGIATVQHVQLRVNGAVAVVVVRYRLRALAARMADLLDQLGETVQTGAEVVQLGLFTGGTQLQVVPEPGRLVTATTVGGEVAGIVRSVLPADPEAGCPALLYVRDVVGDQIVVKLDEVTNVLRVEAGDGTTVAKLLTSYRGKAKRRDLTPSWGALIRAMALAQGGGVDNALAGVVLLTSDTVDAALADALAPQVSPDADAALAGS